MTADESKKVSKTATKKKKKRISKHILESKKEKDGSSIADQANKDQSKVKKKKSKKKKKQSKVKDPKEAAAYLENWKRQQDGDSSVSWKFNKNDQSWLIRHMYRSDRLNKSTFALMIKYLITAANGTKQRVREDAIRRALRYKEWEKKSTDSDNEDSKNEEEQKSATSPKDNCDKNDEIDEERQHWKTLDSHEKRKEYKRARRVLEEVKIGTEPLLSEKEGSDEDD